MKSKVRVITPAQGIRFMVVFAVLDGSAGMFIKMLPWNPFVIAGLRGALASLLLFGYYKSQGIKMVTTKRTLLAGCMISAMFISFIAATRLTASANAIALQYCNPIFLLFLSFFILKQKPKRRDILAVLGVLAGIAMIFSGSVTASGLSGNLLAILSGLCLAGMLLFNNLVKDPAEHYGALVSGHAITFLASIYFIIAYPPSFGIKNTLAILALGVLQQLIPIILYSYAIRVCQPLVCSLIMMLQLVINPLLVFLVTGETPTVLEALGCAAIFLVSAAVLAVNTKTPKNDGQTA